MTARQPTSPAGANLVWPPVVMAAPTTTRPSLADDPALTEPMTGEHSAMTRWLENELPTHERWKPSEHTRLVKQTMDALAKLPGLKRIRKRQVGRFIVTDAAGNPRKQNGRWIYVKVSIAGDPDIELSWAPPGWDAGPIMVGVECKTGNAVLSADQKKERDELVAMGWRFVECRSAAQAFQAVLDMARGL